MTVYETGRSEFRPRPSWGLLFAFGLFAFLLSDVIHGALIWLTEMALAWNSGWGNVVIVELHPLGDAASRFYVSPPLG
ncbi:MAG: hypothetical protein R3338_14555, partial [Thermoanaerobaculia bacterium]|nr:hypothetical protein [Thermoanaerobaculia bacterium]